MSQLYAAAAFSLVDKNGCLGQKIKFYMIFLFFEAVRTLRGRGFCLLEPSPHPPPPNSEWNEPKQKTNFICPFAGFSVFVHSPLHTLRGTIYTHRRERGCEELSQGLKTWLFACTNNFKGTWWRHGGHSLVYFFPGWNSRFIGRAPWTPHLFPPSAWACSGGGFS